MVGPAAKREAVAHLRAALGLSERRACHLVGVERTMIRYRSCRPDDAGLRARLRKLPTRWTLKIKSRGLDIACAPLNPQSWMGTSFPYWEGPIHVSGNHPGRGYLEMTGY
jgi:hypothetical protein